MKKLRFFAFAMLFILLVASILPFFIPIQETGISPSELVDDSDGAFISLQGISLYYEDKGEPDAPAVVLLHGLFGSTETWRYNVDALVENGFRVLAIDRVGFGLSDKPETFDYSMSNQVQLLVEWLNALQVDTFDLVGHSAGGNVATHFVSAHPERVNKLVLVDGAVLAGGPPPFVGSFIAFPPIWRWARIGLRAFFTRENLEQSLGSFYVDGSFLEHVMHFSK